MHFARAADREAALDHTGSECGPLEYSTLNLWEGAFDPKIYSSERSILGRAFDPKGAFDPKRTHPASHKPNTLRARGRP